MVRVAPLVAFVACAASGLVQCEDRHVRPRRSLREIFADYGTDKGWRHGYHRYYERELAPYRDQLGVRVLEIGAHLGSSLKAWVEYFAAPAAIHAIDNRVDPVVVASYACAFRPSVCDVVKIHVMDQTDIGELGKLATAEPAGWDVIIDDASHVPLQQLLSFSHLFPQLRPGGLYVVEDLQTSYEEHPALPGNMVERLKDLIDVVMRGHFMEPNFTVLGGRVDQDIVRIAFGDGIAFLEKRPMDEDWHEGYPTMEAWAKPKFALGVHRLSAQLAARLRAAPNP